jgi:uncharacterized protein (DUF1697 family)
MTMITYVSFLRGINVGGRIIKMPDLISCYEENGLTNVSTLLNSGNVTFSCDDPKAESVRGKLETALEARFNYPAKVFVLRKPELEPLVERYPFDASNPQFQHYLVFVRPGLVDKIVNLAPKLNPQIEQISAGDGILYWTVCKGLSVTSTFSKALTKPEFKNLNTVRNINTVRKLAL